MATALLLAVASFFFVVHLSSQFLRDALFSSRLQQICREKAFSCETGSCLSMGGRCIFVIYNARLRQWESDDGIIF